MTDGNIQKRIELFNIVRDIPYYIASSIYVQDYSCVTKPFILEKLLSTAGLESRHRICTFCWGDLPIPKEILAISSEQEDTHGYLEVKIPETGQWASVDPNWDSRLRHTGLPIAEWDGIHDTILGVLCRHIYSSEESSAIIKEEDLMGMEQRENYLVKNKAFFEGINLWIETQRTKR